MYCTCNDFLSSFFWSMQMAVYRGALSRRAYPISKQSKSVQFTSGRNSRIMHDGRAP